jgi:DNA topoisomerase II
METDTSQGQQNETKGRKGPSKRGATKKASSSLAVISSDDEDDFAMKEVSEVETQKKGRGRKPAAADKPKATTTRKRAPAQGKVVKQRVVDEMLKPIEEGKTTVLSINSELSESSAETSPPSGGSIVRQPRRTARTTKKATVVYDESDDSEDEVEVSDDSDFYLNGNSDDE